MTVYQNTADAAHNLVSTSENPVELFGMSLADVGINAADEQEA